MPSPLHAALVAVGSHGDVHPFVGLGVRLLSRGHRVTVLTNEHFEPLVRAAGLGFASIGTDAEYRQITGDPDLWHAQKGFHVIARNICELIPRVYDALARMRADDGDRLVAVGSTLALGARVAQETLGVPLATVHLSPAVFQSVYEMPKLTGLPVPQGAPRWLKAAAWSVVNWVVDRSMAGPLNDYRRTHGLPPVKGVFRSYIHSPQLVLATFPDWFAAVQPDWPPNTRAVGFPLYDERGLTPLPAALERFLAAGPPPVAFTPGSAMFHGRAFFAASAEACRRSSRRGVLLTRHADQVPVDLPPGVVHVDYAPFSELLPRCAAVVHHGGVGSCAQALAAGVPQLIQPFAHDQPDNARRLGRMGVAATVPPRKYTPRNVARVLDGLIGSQDVARSCAGVAARLRDADAPGEACALIEGLAPGGAARDASPRATPVAGATVR
jgi:rhamnosyltransferase subunit B